VNQRTRRWVVRQIPLLIVVILVCSTVATAFVVRSVVDDQEHRLLQERAGEVGAVLSVSMNQSATMLPLLGALTQPAVAGPAQFEAVANGIVSRQKRGTIGAAESRAGNLVVVAAAGDGPTRGQVLDGPRAALARRALGASGMVSSVRRDGDRQRLTFAVALPGATPLVLYQDLVLDRAPVTLDKDSPFAGIEGALYGSTRANADAVVVTTTNDLPIGGEVARSSVKIGDDQWLLVIRSKEPLVGTFAKQTPWIVLIAGLFTALLIGSLVAVLSRRRAYAQAAVDARTAELKLALAEQERLEEGQRRAREVAEAANQSKSEFLSRMSHELRTPMNAVLGYAQLIEDDPLDDAQRDAVEQILKGGRHLLQLINEVLDITRIETGDFAISPEPVLASDVIAEAMDLTKPLAMKADLHLVGGVTADTSEVYVLADRQRLSQILLNLVSNAIKYNRSGGTVSLSCEAVEGHRLRIKVIDTGPGIRPEHLELLFAPFERLGAEQSTIEGTGIGLALSRRLAEAMGGTLDVATSPGQGSTFWVELPVVEDPVDRYTRLQVPQSVANVEVPQHSGGAPKILYIEDNLSNLRLIERILAPSGPTQLVSAMQGRLGLELAREHRPDLVLLDLHLPDIGGDEVLRRLRDDPHTASIPVVILSADATPGQIQRLLHAGASEYLTKPLDVRQLREVLGRLTGSPADTTLKV
jgi:signal transduction histidine kinase/ActR/RegA family two-component response regulator